MTPKTSRWRHLSACLVTSFVCEELTYNTGAASVPTIRSSLLGRAVALFGSTAVKLVLRWLPGLRVSAIGVVVPGSFVSAIGGVVLGWGRL